MLPGIERYENLQTTHGAIRRFNTGINHYMMPVRPTVKAGNAMRELRKNIAAYRAMQDRLEREHRGRVALLHDGTLVRVLDDRWDAYLIGMERFGEGRFSIKTIGGRAASLGAAAVYAEPVPIE